MIIRKANMLDISAIIYLLFKMHEETTIKPPKINSVKLLEKINYLFHKGIVLVAEVDNKIVGSIAGQVTEDWWSDEKYIADAWFYVYKSNRKSLVAKKLIIQFMKVAKEAKLKLRLGHIFSGDMDRKDKFFTRMGLQKVGSTFMEV